MVDSSNESTDNVNTAQLAIFVREIDKNFEVIKDLLSLVPMHGTTTGEDIFNSTMLVVHDFYLSLQKLSKGAIFY